MASETRQRAGRDAKVKPGIPDATQQEHESKKENKTRSSKCWGLIGSTATVGILIGIAIALLPCPIEPLAFTLPPPPVWTGALAPNDVLTRADRLYENVLFGPESIVVHRDTIYTGTSDGRVVSIHKGVPRTLARFGRGRNCGSFESEPTCGRPLGMRMDRDGNLLVADAYLGIFRVNASSGRYRQLLTLQASRNAKLLNDIEEGPGGTIYFTDSSMRWDRRHNRYCIMEAETSGRLLSYNPITYSLKELIKGLAFANGVAISYDKTHILVVETTKARIWRYYLSGIRQGTRDIFIDNLPGFPDNIRRSGRGTYWVGIAAVRRAGKLSLLDMVAPYPWLRKLITKLLSQEMIMAMVPKYGLAIEINQNGQIVRTLHDPTGAQVPSSSEVEEKDGTLYIGSYNLPFMSRVSLY